MTSVPGIESQTSHSHDQHLTTEPSTLQSYKLSLTNVILEAPLSVRILGIQTQHMDPMVRAIRVLQN
jgi:hypothetical protein